MCGFKHNDINVTNGTWNKIVELSGSSGDYLGSGVALNTSGAYVAVGAQRTTSYAGAGSVYETGVQATISIPIHAVPPDLVSDSLSIVSNNSNTTKAKATDEVTLSFEYDLSINTPTVSFKSNGQDITDTSIDYIGTNDNTSWTAKYTVDSSDTDGSVTFTIDATAQTTATDATQLTESDITDGTNVIIDTTVPTITNTVISNDNLNLSVTVSEKISGSSTYSDTTMVFNVTYTGGLGGGYYIVSGGNITDPYPTNHPINCNAGQTIVFSMATTDYNTYKLGIGNGQNYNEITNLDDTDSRFSTTVDGDNTLISFTPTENSSEWYYYCAQDPYPQGWGAQITVSNGIETTDFTLSLTGGSSATLQSNTPTNITTLDNLTYDMSLNISGTATGEETLTIVPASSTSIYDAVGNAMSTTQSNNSVNLTDLALPTINTLTISSNNSIKTNYAGENDIVTLYITASEDIIEPTVVFKSNDVEITNTVSYSGSGTIWTAQYTVSSDDTNGVISFVLDIEDVAGNTNQRTLTTDSSSVTKVGVSYLVPATITTTHGEQVGASINGGTSNEQSGQSVSFNNDGKIIAIGAHGYSSYKGATRIYEWISESWSQIGSTIEGDADSELGYSVSLNGDGSIVAIGAPSNAGGGTKRGEVRVYQKDNANNWLQLGSDLNGETDNDEFGYSIDINSDGDTLAVGTKDLSHNTAVYKYDSGSWSLYGNTIKNNVSSGNIFTTEGTTPNYGTTISTESGSSGWANLTTSDETILKANNPGTSDQFGYSVAISGDYAIFGAFREDTSNDDSGAAYIFERTNGTWTQVQWLKASEAAEDDYFGYSVAISGDYAIVGAIEKAHKVVSREQRIFLNVTQMVVGELLFLANHITMKLKS